MRISSNESLVSIIMPAYNSELYITEAINSVVEQIYTNWELIIVDDCSTDRTKEIVSNMEKMEKRIKYKRLNVNSGAAKARNTALEMAKGKYISFLDSDDTWTRDKLRKQISYMETYDYSFTCTSYSKIDESGNETGEVVNTPMIRDYNKLLKNNCGNSTVIYNSEKLGVYFIPDIKKRNDYVMWLQIIKKAKYLYGYNEVLSSHRVRNGSLSNKKASLIKYHWIAYRDIEKLSVFKSVYLILYWILKTIF